MAEAYPFQWNGRPSGGVLEGMNKTASIITALRAAHRRSSQKWIRRMETR